MRLIKLLLFCIALCLLGSIGYGQDTKVPFAVSPVGANKYAWTPNGLWVDSSVKFPKYASTDTVVFGILPTTGKGIPVTKAMISSWANSTPSTGYIHNILSGWQATSGFGVSYNSAVGDDILTEDRRRKFNVFSDSLNPTNDDVTGIYTENRIGYNTGDSTRDLLLVGIQSVARTKSTASSDWYPRANGHPNIISGLFSFSPTTGAAPYIIPYVSVVDGGYGSATNITVDRATSFRAGVNHSGTTRYYTSFTAEDNDNATLGNTVLGAWYGGSTYQYPGTYFLQERMAEGVGNAGLVRSYLQHPLIIGTDTAYSSTYILKVTGKEITSDIDVYGSDLSGSYTARTKIDKGFADATYAPIAINGTVTSVGLAAGTTGTDVNITGSPVTTSGTITLNIPSASATARGLVTTSSQTIAGNKTLTGTTTITGSTTTVNPSSTLTTGTRAFRVFGTFPTDAGAQVGTFIDHTSAGSLSISQISMNAYLRSGYTGSGMTIALQTYNNAAGTGTNLQLGSSISNPVANSGLNSFADATTTGTNIGGYNEAANGNANFGIIAKTTTAKNSATNVAVLAVSLNTGTTPINVGGYFGLQNATPTFTSAALMCDNGSTTDNIFVARDNGTAVLTVADGGAVISTGTISTTKYFVSALNTPPANAGDTGTTGEIRFGSDGYLYLCTATNTWVRVQLATW